jgi:hypothetical protein
MMEKKTFNFRLLEEAKKVWCPSDLHLCENKCFLAGNPSPHANSPAVAPGLGISLAVGKVLWKAGTLDHGMSYTGRERLPKPHSDSESSRIA